MPAAKSMVHTTIFLSDKLYRQLWTHQIRGRSS